MDGRTDISTHLMRSFRGNDFKIPASFITEAAYFLHHCQNFVLILARIKAKYQSEGFSRVILESKQAHESVSRTEDAYLEKVRNRGRSFI